MRGGKLRTAAGLVVATVAFAAFVPLVGAAAVFDAMQAGAAVVASSFAEYAGYYAVFMRQQMKEFKS
ncbi:hypothetical protein [Rhizobium phage RHph_X2_26]|nr:hypothetical protein [Rhizobium phage RHph_X2_26]